MNTNHTLALSKPSVTNGLPNRSCISVSCLRANSDLEIVAMSSCFVLLTLGVCVCVCVGVCVCVCVLYYECMKLVRNCPFLTFLGTHEDILINSGLFCVCYLEKVTVRLLFIFYFQINVHVHLLFFWGLFVIHEHCSTVYTDFKLLFLKNGKYVHG